MFFGKFPPNKCLNAILAHSLKLSDKTFKKGTQLSAEDVKFIEDSNVEKIWVAILGDNDLHENDAASILADALDIEHLKRDKAATGRANLFATTPGLFQPNRKLINEFNRIDPAITLATLDEFTPVVPNRMVATIKIIPFGVDKQIVAKAERLLNSTPAALAIKPYEQQMIAVLSTTLPQPKNSTIGKTLKVLEGRLEDTGSVIQKNLCVSHTEEAIRNGISELLQSSPDMIIIFGASAITDMSDIIPASIKRVGGSILHFGLPVDPGNLLLLGEVNNTRIIGAPGCARSPLENGFDWVLQRSLAGVKIDSHMMTGMGVGGLLKEIVSRPAPRRGSVEYSDNPRIGVVVLAAGQSSRMKGSNKLLAEVNGVPMVRITVESALNSHAEFVSVVTGHMADEISKALDGLKFKQVYNPDFTKGLSTSLSMGIKSLPELTDGALIMLADMPKVGPEQVNSLIAEFNPNQGQHIVVSTCNGRRGNPVIWSRRHFGELCELKGDVGARHLIESNTESVVEVELGEVARLDVDTRQDLSLIGGKQIGN